MDRSVGWFDKPGQVVPSHYPAPEAPCPFCGKPIGITGRVGAGGKSVLVATNVMAVGAARSYFYIAHRACRDSSSADRMTDIESAIIDGVN